MVRKSRHVRDDSDPLLGLYSQTLAATSSVRNPAGTLYVPDSPEANENSPLKKTFRLFTSPGRSSGDGSGNDNDDDIENGSVQQHKSAASGSSSTSPTRKKPGYRVHRVSYTAHNHVQVLFRLYGSAMPTVLPFCLLNVAWTFVIVILREYHICDLTFHSSVGHSFMGLLVSFLIVSRSQISYNRFMDYRRKLAVTYRVCRELAHATAVYTFQTQTEQAKQWRQEVCYRTILLLRVTMDALLWSSTEREEWEEEYFRYRKEDGESPVSDHFFELQQLTHGHRSMIDENFRAPITFQLILRRTIMEHPNYLGYKMAVNEYRDLLNFVSLFNDAFHEFRVLVFTPYPFPLVQMTRTFLFFWVYTLPMVLLKDYRVWSSLLIISLVSFGFIGIEYVSIALDDPFSDDSNDIDEHGMALLVYEDVYLAIYRTDGPAAAFALRERVLERYRQGRGLDCYRDDLKHFGMH